MIKINNIKGQFGGLRENKDDCINIVVSRFNNTKIRITGSKTAKVVRLLIDCMPVDESAFFDYLNTIYSNNPNMEFHINIELDGFFEYAKTVMSKVSFNKKSITLWPDGRLADRSYLNLNNLNCNTIIPIQYVMWHDSIEKVNSSNLFFNRTDVEVHDGTLPFSTLSLYKNNGHQRLWNFSELYNLRDALFLKSVAYKVLNTELKDLVGCSLADDQKILTLMKYFVDNYVYTENIKISNRVSSPNSLFAHRAANVLVNKQGVCEGIAEAFMILLNNPLMRIDCRCLGGLADETQLSSGHSWNVIKLLDEKYYRTRWFYMDPTWNINEHSYYKWSFLKASDISKRKIFDCANPVYESFDNVVLNKKVMSRRLKDAMERINGHRTGVVQCRVHKSLNEIADETKKNRFHF